MPRLVALRRCGRGALFSRRAYVDYQAPPRSPRRHRDRAAAPAPRLRPWIAAIDMTELTYELPEVVRWRNFLLGERRVASVPLDSLERAVASRASAYI